MSYTICTNIGYGFFTDASYEDICAALEMAGLEEDADPSDGVGRMLCHSRHSGDVSFVGTFVGEDGNEYGVPIPSEAWGITPPRSVIAALAKALGEDSKIGWYAVVWGY